MDIWDPEYWRRIWEALFTTGVAADAILGALVSVVLGAAASALSPWAAGFLAKKKGDTYDNQVAVLLKRLETTSKEVNDVMQEIAFATKQRQENMIKLEQEIIRLQMVEKEQRDKIEALKSIPLPVVDYLLKETAPSERRSARRDYILFFAGVVTSTAISIILNLLGVGS